MSGEKITSEIDRLDLLSQTRDLKLTPLKEHRVRAQVTFEARNKVVGIPYDIHLVRSVKRYLNFYIPFDVYKNTV